MRAARTGGGNDALVEALVEHRIRAAVGRDRSEPLPADHPAVERRPNCLNQRRTSAVDRRSHPPGFVFAAAQVGRSSRRANWKML